MVIWIIEYAVLALFWLWIARWGGAEWIEGRIKVFAYGALFIGTVLFILGIFSQDFRVFGLL